jgi:hypothetical protein
MWMPRKRSQSQNVSDGIDGVRTEPQQSVVQETVFDMVGAWLEQLEIPSSWRVLKEPEAMPVPSADDLALAPLVGADLTVIVFLLVASMTCLQ